MLIQLKTDDDDDDDDGPWMPIQLDPAGAQNASGHNRQIMVGGIFVFSLLHLSLEVVGKALGWISEAPDYASSADEAVSWKGIGMNFAGLGLR